MIKLVVIAKLCATRQVIIVQSLMFIFPLEQWLEIQGQLNLISW
jgi:hypothetical protein